MDFKESIERLGVTSYDLLSMLHVQILVDFNMIFGPKFNIVKNCFKHLFNTNIELLYRLKV